LLSADRPEGDRPLGDALRPDGSNWTADGRLRVCLLSYRSNPFSGGQGVYVRNLSQALAQLGHTVEVVSGPPHLDLDPAVRLHEIPCLDLYRPDDPFRIPTLRELSSPINLVEWMSTSTMGFPEPFTFGLRAYRFLRRRFANYDVIHDNQSLSYGLLAMQRHVPTIATVHHPITVDREVAIRSERWWWKKLKWMRWYSFLGMQKRVTRRLPRLITVSECARQDIGREFRVPLEHLKVVPNGINTGDFFPMPHVERSRDRILVTNSADTPLKGLPHLLDAVAELRRRRRVKLIVVGTPKEDGVVLRRVRELSLGDEVEFTGHITHAEFVRQYAQAAVAVVPSVYEGFGLPAGEAMACGVPVVSTTGGALPEVVGEAGILVPPADPRALAAAISHVLDHPDQAKEMSQRGLERVRTLFTWRRAAEQTVAVYREAIHGHS